MDWEGERWGVEEEKEEERKGREKLVIEMANSEAGFP